MAVDCIEIDVITPRKPQVLRIGRTLGIPTAFAYGAVSAVWCWAKQHFPPDGSHLDDATDEDIDANGCIVGLAAAMREVGWLADAPEGRGLILPGYERHAMKRGRRRSNAECDSVSIRNALETPENRKQLTGCDSVSIRNAASMNVDVDVTTVLDQREAQSAGIVRGSRADQALALLKQLPRWRRSIGTDRYALEALDELERRGEDPLNLTRMLISRSREQHRGPGWIANGLRKAAGLPASSQRSRDHRNYITT